MRFTVAQPFFEVKALTETVTEQLNNGSYILVSNQFGSIYQMMGMAFITITDYANGCTYTPVVGGDWREHILLFLSYENYNYLTVITLTLISVAVDVVLGKYINFPSAGIYTVPPSCTLSAVAQLIKLIEIMLL